MIQVKNPHRLLFRPMIVCMVPPAVQLLRLPAENKGTERGWDNDSVKLQLPITTDPTTV